MTPSDLIASGTIAARLSSADTLGNGVPLAALPPPEDSSELPPHPVRTRAALVTAAAAPAARRARERAGTGCLRFLGVRGSILHRADAAWEPRGRHGPKGCRRSVALVTQPGGLTTVGEVGGLGDAAAGRDPFVVTPGLVVSTGPLVSAVGPVLVAGARVVVPEADVVGLVGVARGADVVARAGCSGTVPVSLVVAVTGVSGRMLRYRVPIARNRMARTTVEVRARP